MKICAFIWYCFSRFWSLSGTPASGKNFINSSDCLRWKALRFALIQFGFQPGIEMICLLFLLEQNLKIRHPLLTSRRCFTSLTKTRILYFTCLVFFRIIRSNQMLAKYSYAESKTFSLLVLCDLCLRYGCVSYISCAILFLNDLNLLFFVLPSQTSILEMLSAIKTNAKLFSDAFHLFYRLGKLIK